LAKDLPTCGSESAVLVGAPSGEYPNEYTSPNTYAQVMSDIRFRSHNAKVVRYFGPDHHFSQF